MDFLPRVQPPPRIGCRYRKCTASFGRKTDAHRHERQVHQPAKIFCKFASCRFRGTVRAEVMRRHLKSKHPFEVESTFQIDIDSLDGGLPKVKIPRDSSSENYKIDSFTSWSSRLLPTASTSNETHEGEPTIETHIEMGYDDLLGNLNPLNDSEEVNLGLPTFEYAADNQQTLDYTHSTEIQGGMKVLCYPYVSCWNGYSSAGERLLEYRLGPLGSKECQVDSKNTLIDNPILY